MASIWLTLLLLLCPLSWLIVGANQPISPEIYEEFSAVDGMSLVIGEGYEGVIFPAEQAPDLALWSSIPVDSYWTPSSADIQALESSLPTYLSANASLFQRDIAAELPNYVRQYVGYTSDGDRYIYVNAVCDRGQVFDLNWQKDFIQVDDGGDCFFQLSYNLDRDVFAGIQINGEA